MGILRENGDKQLRGFHNAPPARLPCFTVWLVATDRRLAPGPSGPEGRTPCLLQGQAGSSCSHQLGAEVSHVV